MAAEVAYNRLGDPVLLDKIDKLFACNVGEHIALPQLVVVGDQSSGKSSVLEGLSRLPFPRDSGLCTKFATQISFRRAPQKSINVSVIPDAQSSMTHKAQVKAWTPPKMSSLDAKLFAQIIKDVHNVMDLGSKESPDGAQKTFSRDILKIENRGPQEDQLTIIDVPGIFRAATKGKTTADDMKTVRDMVEGFMKNERSVMLAVVPANVDIATQEILEMAKKVDPEARRTLGVLTKPDLVDQGAEQDVIELIENIGGGDDDALEWSVVRNPGQSDLEKPNLNRQAVEEQLFRERAPWNKLAEDKRGIASLRKRLEGVLTSHIRHEFPKVKQEVSDRLAARRRLLNALGAERDTVEQQMLYLSDLATRFHSIAARAIKADYGGSDLFVEEGNTRLATAMVTRNDMFLHDMDGYGHEFPLDDEEAKYTTKENTSEPISTALPFSGEESIFSFESALNGADDGLSTTRDRKKRKNVPVTYRKPPFTLPETRVGRHRNRFVRYESNATALDSILHENEAVSTPSSYDMLKWLEATYRKSRGIELGTFDSSLLPVAMKKQATKWGPLAMGYISDAVAIVHDFITQMIWFLCEDERVFEQLMSLLQDKLTERYKKAIDQVHFILRVELDGTPLTLNHYFNENLQKCRQDRIKNVLAANVQTIKGAFAGAVEMVPLNAVLKTTNMSNVQHTVQEMHDILGSYYKVARKRFVDYVCMHAAGYHLIDGPDTPLKLFSPPFVARLTHEQLEYIAGEDVALKRRRAQLNKEIKELEEGKKILM